MKSISATQIESSKTWTMIIYSEPGKGKTSMLKSLKGKTKYFSVDGMYHVLQGLPDITIDIMDPKNPVDDLATFYKSLVKDLDNIDNIVIDNLSTYQKYWLNYMAKKTKSGMPELKDYAIIDRILMDFVASLKDLGKNLIIFAHEKKEEIVKESGGVYTQHQPDIRNLNAIMGIVPIVGRLVVLKNQETQESERIIVLQPTQSTKAKDQLIGNIDTVKQMELIPKLQNKK